MSRTPSAKFKTPTCVLCRQRKLTVGQLRSELPKGAACISCRQVTSQVMFPELQVNMLLIDVERGTCKSTSRPQECQYRDRPLGRSADPADQDRLFLPDGASACSSRSTNTSHDIAGYSPRPLLPGNTDIEALLNLYLPLPQSAESFHTSTNDQEFPGSRRSYAADTIALPSLPYLGHVPRNHTSSPGLLDLDLERSAELFAVRNLFLNHCWDYGLNLSAEKRDALSRGDTSGLIVSPALVQICQLLGYFISDHSHSEWWQYSQGQTQGETGQATIIFDVLDQGRHLLDTSTEMQVSALFALYYGMKGDISVFIERWVKLGDLLRRNLAMFDTIPFDCPAQLNSESCCPRGPAQEALSNFSQIIFVEVGRSLVRGLPLILDSSILAKFRQLTVMHRTNTELNFMRAKSILFLFDSQQIVAEWGRELGQPGSKIWSDSYWNLIEDVHAHLKVVDTPLLEVSFIHEAQVLTLKTAVIIALAALADLYALFAPFQPELRRKHSGVVEQVGVITSMFCGKEFQYLDAILGVCWSIALRPIIETDSTGNWDSSSAGHLPDVSRPALDIIRECHRRLRQKMPNWASGLPR
ncbi:hypothetical protein B0H17DRAFT_1142635 [Mycena rosella]|uniref:Uncharacterized protein n=1 Tax=Mycena rosella TaxID=1033263 RepID=A0AAD7G7S4_MYCRO|nr:hypothetical protein B0H17DRAFT_1142635 [Mycena rosella]